MNILTQLKPVLYRVHLYEDGNTYININLLTSIDKPDTHSLYFALGEHFVHDFPFKSKEDALQAFNEILALCEVK